VTSSPAAGLIHEVQRGDTLSSIAGKYLGSQARFHEIFEANKDQLRDANDLQVGMKLRIPDAEANPDRTDSSSPKRLRTSGERRPDDSAVSENAKNAASQDYPATPAKSSTEASSKFSDNESADTKPPEPPKLKFTPAKRRPLRHGAAATP
jgi:LysM repeat protein